MCDVIAVISNKAARRSRLQPALNSLLSRANRTTRHIPPLNLLHFVDMMIMRTIVSTPLPKRTSTLRIRIHLLFRPMTRTKSCAGRPRRWVESLPSVRSSASGWQDR